MSWIKIEFQRDSEKEPAKKQIEPIDYEKLTAAIVQANAKIEEMEQAKAKEEKQKIRASRKVILKEKDFSYIKCPLWREVRVFFNNLRVAWNLLTLTREEAQSFTAVNELTRLLTSLLLYVIGLAFYALAGFFAYKAFLTGSIIAGYIPYIFLPVVIARLIRIARFEVERMKNETQLTNVAMLLVALVTLAATIVSVVVSMQNNGG